jgi:hypothetical protein
MAYNVHAGVHDTVCILLYSTGQIGRNGLKLFTRIYILLKEKAYFSVELFNGPA